MSSKQKTITLNDHELALKQSASRYEDKIDYLNFKIEELRQALYGKKSEKQKYIGSEYIQGELFEVEELSAPIVEELEEVKQHKRRKPNKPRFPENAEREINNLELSEEKRLCDCCGVVKEFIGFDSSEKAHIIPAKCIIREDRRFKYACKKCKNTGVAIAAVATSPFPKTRITEQTRAHFLVSKFSDHIPYYRQSKILKRDGIELADSSLVHYSMESADVLSPIVWAMLTELTSGNYLQVDETTLPVLKTRKSGKGAHRGYLWGYSKPGESIVFLYEHGRGKKYPASVLENFSGILQTDRYAGYIEIQARENVVDLACWAHARRKFVEAKRYTASKAGPLLTLISKLYRVETAARDQKLTGQLRAELRRKHAVPVLSDLHDALIEQMQGALPSGPLGKAIHYTLDHWGALARYVNYGEAEIDNNLIENSMRPIAIGRKNYMFAGSEGGAAACSVIYSITESCRRLGVDPRKYLVYVFEKLGELGEADLAAYCALTPARFAAD